MASVKETFNAMISKAIENTELIETPKDKAIAYAAIASALAQTGRVSDIIAEPLSEPVKEKPKKNADKMKKQPGFLPPDKEEILGEPVEETKKKIEEQKKESVPKFTSEWTDEAQEYYKDEFEYLEQFLEKWDEDSFNQCLADFSSGTIKDFDGINPLNISALVTYLKVIDSQLEEEKSN